jgi:hypothetical protein
MLVNRQSRGWIIACAVLLIIATAVYIPCAMNRPRGISGGSVLGLVYGSAGTAMMTFALLLGLRKRYSTLRVGRAYHWLQGHVWLGILSYPIILFHAGFRFFGSPMGIALMSLFAVVFISGIVGMIVQQYVPAAMIRDVPGETIYEQIGHVLEELRTQAQGQLKLLERRGDNEGGGGGTMTAVRAPAATMELHNIYQRSIKPFLEDRIPSRTPFASAESTNAEFQRLSARLPVEQQGVLERLRAIVDDRRQLERQRHTYALLHSWLLIHVPVSYGLMLLVVVHAVVAVRYGIPGH